MYDKLIINSTPYNTIRVWLYFDEKNTSFNSIMDYSNDAKFFQFACIWGGYDKRESGLISWELPVSLAKFLTEKYGYRKDVEIHLI